MIGIGREVVMNYGFECSKVRWIKVLDTDLNAAIPRRSLTARIKGELAYA
jgi:hypothetical protein